MYKDILDQMKKNLGQLDKWLEAATAYAKQRGFDSSVFLEARLAPDQFAFARQVQTACDTTKFAVSRLTTKDAPKNEDTEKTIDELRARVASAIAYLDTFTAKDFEGAGSRVISTPRWEGKVMSGHDYFLQHALPNFYFHITHAYAILRHNGVSIGKRDYLGALDLRDPAK